MHAACQYARVCDFKGLSVSKAPVMAWPGSLRLENGPKVVDDEAGLLHGPSMPDDANSQDDIDAILASFD